MANYRLKMANKNLAVFNRCECCDYNTSNKSDYKKHVLTRKHERNSFMANALAIKVAKNRKNPDDKIIFYHCICGKSYQHQSSLCKHKKFCNVSKQEIHDYNKNEDNEIYIDSFNPQTPNQMVIPIENKIKTTHNNGYN